MDDERVCSIVSSNILLQVRMIRPMRAQACRISTIAETDNSAQFFIHILHTAPSEANIRSLWGAQC